MDGLSENQRSGAWGLIETTAWVALALGLGALLVFGKEVLVPIAVATVLSFALSPVVRTLQKVGVPRVVGAVAALLIFVGAICLWLWFVSAQVSDLASQFPTYRHNIGDKIHALTQHFGGGKASRLSEMLEDAVKEANPGKSAEPPQRVEVVDNSITSRLGVIGSYTAPVLSPLAQFIIVLVFTVFLLAQQEDLRNRLIKLIGPKDIYRTTEAIDDAGRRVGRILFAQVILNSVFGLIITLGLYFIGVPNPALWGAIAGIARFIPYIGVLIGAVPPLLVAFGFEPGWSAFLWTLGLFAVAEGIAGQVVEPLVYGHSSGLSPIAVVVSASVWAFLWGPIGLVLATPLTTCLVVLGRHAPGMAFLETLLGDEPPLAAHETFYQRMLSGDPREAARHARPYLKEGNIADYYDAVALEALRRAHIDVARGDLDETRLEALTATMGQLVARLGASKSNEPRALRALFRRLFRLSGDVAGAEERQDAMLRSRRAAIVVHGPHPLDPIAAAMLVHALTRRGLPNRIVSEEEAARASAAEGEAVGLICLCYIEPLTIAHIRGAVREGRRRCPNAKILVCLWRDPADDSGKGLERKLRCDGVASGVSEAGKAALSLLGLSDVRKARRAWDGSLTAVKRGAAAR